MEILTKAPFNTTVENLMRSDVVAFLRKRLRKEELFQPGVGGLPPASGNTLLDEEVNDATCYKPLVFRWQQGQEIHRERLLASRLIREKILSQAASAL